MRIVFFLVWTALLAYGLFTLFLALTGNQQEVRYRLSQSFMTFFALGALVFLRILGE